MCELRTIDYFKNKVNNYILKEDAITKKYLGLLNEASQKVGSDGLKNKAEYLLKVVKKDPWFKGVFEELGIKEGGFVDETGWNKVRWIMYRTIIGIKEGGFVDETG